MVSEQKYFPIWKLRNNILKAIQNECSFSKEEHKEFIRKGVVKPKIEYLASQPLKYPSVNTKERVISMPEAYLGFLWTAIYFLSMLYERHIIPQLNGGKRVIIDYREDEVLKRAGTLFQWGCSLSMFSAWPSDYPPEKSSADEKRWAKKTNTMWIKACCFVFYHEFGHLVLKHQKTNDTEKQIKMEKDADQFAFNALFSKSTTSEDRTEILLSVTLLMVSNFFLINKINAVKPKAHIALPDRVQSALDYAKFDKKEKNEYFYYLTSLACTLFFRILNIDTKDYLRLNYKSSLDYWNDNLRFLNSEEFRK